MMRCRPRHGAQLVFGGPDRAHPAVADARVQSIAPGHQKIGAGDTVRGGHPAEYRSDRVTGSGRAPLLTGAGAPIR